MQTDRSMRLREKIAIAAAVLVFLLYLVAAASGAARAHEFPDDIRLPAGSADVADLERAFWACDYVATTRGVDAAPLELCAGAYEALKVVKFEGDFLALLAWWESHKPEAHRQLSAADLRLTAD